MENYVKPSLHSLVILIWSWYTIIENEIIIRIQTKKEYSFEHKLCNDFKRYLFPYIKFSLLVYQVHPKISFNDQRIMKNSIAYENNVRYYTG